MVYRAIGILEDLNKVTIVFSELLENAGIWSFDVKANSKITATEGDYGKLVNQFIAEKKLEFQVALVALHSNNPICNFKAGGIAATTKLPVIADLSSMDLALGGNGDFYTSSISKLQLQPNELNELNKAICVAFMGVLRWREEYNFLSSVTGASRNSIGGALWMGQDA